MDLNEVIELLGQEPEPRDQMTNGLLKDAVATFSVNRSGAVDSIRRLQARGPSRLALAALHLLASQPENGPGMASGLQYLADLFDGGDLLSDLLSDEEALPLETAISVARSLARTQPLLDARLMQKMLLNAGGEVQAIKTGEAQRVLRLVDAISDCSRLSSPLTKLLRHPSLEVRSKVALLLGRANLNLTRVQSFLESSDSRVRANAVESLWGQRSAGVPALFRRASQDSCSRAAINALLELCRTGDREAFDRLGNLAGAPDPIQRSGAAWAMGESGDLGFTPMLEKLIQDEDAKVRAMAQKSLAKLCPVPECPVPEEEAPK